MRERLGALWVVAHDEHATLLGELIAQPAILVETREVGHYESIGKFKVVAESALLRPIDAMHVAMQHRGFTTRRRSK